MKTQITNVQRADAVGPGVQFYDLIAGLGHLWTMTAMRGDANERTAVSAEDFRVVAFGEAQLVWVVGGAE
jgi:hypothetical protein